MKDVRKQRERLENISGAIFVVVGVFLLIVLFWQKKTGFFAQALDEVAPVVSGQATMAQVVSAEDLAAKVERIEENHRQIERERVAAERREQERLERERREKERLERERREKERLERERREKERLEAERKEKERLEAERKEKERLEAERKEKERLEAERKEKERLEAERKEKERLERERKEKERLEAERKEKERQAREAAQLAAIDAPSLGISSYDAQAALGAYVLAVQNKISAFWVAPQNVPNNLKASLFLRLNARGEILELRVVQSSGYPLYDEAVIASLQRASPLPMPDAKALSEQIVKEGVVLNF